MNLIEQLGGYEHLNGFYKRAVAHGFALTEIKEELLKYRRQHNIFEVGGYFVNYADDAVYTALSIYQNNRMHGKSGDKNVWTYFGRFGLRHATDEEIKAGKRLEVNQ